MRFYTALNTQKGTIIDDVTKNHDDKTKVLIQKYLRNNRLVYLRISSSKKPLINFLNNKNFLLEMCIISLTQNPSYLCNNAMEISVFRFSIKSTYGLGGVCGLFVSNSECNLVPISSRTGKFSNILKRNTKKISLCK